MFKALRRLMMAQLMQGVSPTGLALTCAFAVPISVFPIVGVTTTMCLIFGAILRLNQPTMQAINYLLTPFHFLLIPVFLRIGEKIYGADPVSLNPKTLWSEFMTDQKLFLDHYGWAGLHALTAWALIMVPIGFLVFFAARPLFRRLEKKIS